MQKSLGSRLTPEFHLISSNPLLKFKKREKKEVRKTLDFAENLVKDIHPSK